MAAYTAIDDPEAYFQVKTYTGDESDGRQISLNFQPGLVWTKVRIVDNYNTLIDSVRGAANHLYADNTTAERTSDPNDGIGEFNSSGYTVDWRTGWYFTNGAPNGPTGGTYVSWSWKESATSGFDIVAYTGNGTDDTDISHNLSAVPKMIIVKNRDATDAWQVYHGANTAAPETDYLVLDTNAATVDAADRWSDEAPTSSVFTLGDGDEVNTNTETYIAYCFAEKQGFSKFGTYEGNGNADGTFVYTGFRPAYVMCKSIDSTSSWLIFDDQREGYNVDNNALAADVSVAETTTDMIDILSNGFKCRIATDPNVAETYVYVAFAKAPFVNSNGVPCNAR